jgi:hypothetical protein
MHNQTASGHWSPSRKAVKTDINGTAAAGGLRALAVANPISSSRSAKTSRSEQVVVLTSL